MKGRRGGDGGGGRGRRACLGCKRQAGPERSATCKGGVRCVVQCKARVTGGETTLKKAEGKTLRQEAEREGKGEGGRE
jgi:hypothetical protein